MKTAVVILNYNGQHFLQQFLPTVLLHSVVPNTEVFVADNASTDNSVAYLKTNFPQVRLIELSENYGYTGGYNRALKQIDAEYYVLLNSDVEVTKGWLASPILYMDLNSGVAACQPKIRAFADKTKFEYAGAAGGFIDHYGFPFCRGRIFSCLETDSAQYDNVMDIFWATGACLFVRAKDFWQAGGLDDDFFAHMEEIDLCWRLKSRGKRVVCVPESTVFHVGGGTLTTESPRKTYLNFRNNLLLLYKNLPEKDLEQVFRFRAFADRVAAVQFFLLGNFSNSLSVWRAHRDFKRMKTDFVEKRRENMEKCTVQNPTGIYPKSIIAAFYLQGKKRFTDLFKHRQLPLKDFV